MQLTRMRATWAFQALADETRLRVVRALASVGSPLTAGQIARALEVNPTHLSRHLHVLEVAAITETVREGRFHCVNLGGSNPAAASLFAAVLATRDDSGVLTADLERLSRFGIAALP